MITWAATAEMQPGTMVEVSNTARQAGNHLTVQAWNLITLDPTPETLKAVRVSVGEFGALVFVIGRPARWFERRDFRVEIA